MLDEQERKRRRRRRKRRWREQRLRAQTRARSLENVRTLRMAAGLTREELAKRSGVSFYTIVDIEQIATKDPALSTAIKLAQALGVTVGQLAGVESLFD